MCPEEAGRCGICNTGVVVCNIGQAGWVFSWRSSGSSCGVSKELWAYRNTLEQRLEGCGELVGVQSRISNRLKQAGMKWLSKRLHVSREGQLQSCEISSLRTYLLSDVPFFSRHLIALRTRTAPKDSCRLRHVGFRRCPRLGIRRLQVPHDMRRIALMRRSTSGGRKSDAGIQNRRCGHLDGMQS